MFHASLIMTIHRTMGEDYNTLYLKTKLISEGQMHKEFGLTFKLPCERDVSVNPFPVGAFENRLWTVSVLLPLTDCESRPKGSEWRRAVPDNTGTARLFRVRCIGIVGDSVEASHPLWDSEFGWSCRSIRMSDRCWAGVEQQTGGNCSQKMAKNYSLISL